MYGNIGRTFFSYQGTSQDTWKILPEILSHIAGAPNENIVQNHFNIALLNVF